MSSHGAHLHGVRLMPGPRHAPGQGLSREDGQDLGSGMWLLPEAGCQAEPPISPSSSTTQSELGLCAQLFPVTRRRVSPTRVVTNSIPTGCRALTSKKTSGVLWALLAPPNSGRH